MVPDMIRQRKYLTNHMGIVYTTTCKEKNFTGGSFIAAVIIEEAACLESRINNTSEQDPLGRIVELSLLYDFYGALLKEHKRKIFEDYILNDYSLSEIAGECGISRQGVHDLVKRCSRELEEYEDKLCLIKKFQNVKKKVTRIQQTAGDIRESGELGRIERIEQLAEEILDEL